MGRKRKEKKQAVEHTVTHAGKDPKVHYSGGKPPETADETADQTIDGADK